MYGAFRLSLRAAASSRPVLVRTLPRPIQRPFARFESSEAATPEKPKEIRKQRKQLAKDWTAPIITYEVVKAMSESPGLDAYLIDVREPDEVAQGSIPSSVNLPLSVLATDLQLPRHAFKEKHGFDKPRKEQEITFYCRSGKRSASAADVAKRNGFTNIQNYDGSWLDWVKREGKKGAA